MTADNASARKDVQRWYGRLMAQGARATVSETVITPTTITLALKVHWPATDPDDYDRPAVIYQIFRHSNGVVIDIRGFPDRADAIAEASVDRNR